MNIERQIIKTSFDGKQCYVHARGLILPTGFGLMTMQKLNLSGCDVFYGMEMMKTTDGGNTFSAPVECKHLTRHYDENGNSIYEVTTIKGFISLANGIESIEERAFQSCSSRRFSHKKLRP